MKLALSVANVATDLVFTVDMILQFHTARKLLFSTIASLAGCGPSAGAVCSFEADHCPDASMRGVFIESARVFEDSIVIPAQFDYLLIL
eukprot:2705696-Rhodomonas_salina.11